MVQHVDKARALGWSDAEVVERWTQLYKAPPLVEHWLAAPDTLGKAELAVVKGLVELW